MMDLCEAFIAGAARDVIGSRKIKFGDQEIDYTPPWPRRRYADLLKEYGDVDLDAPDGVSEYLKLTDKAQELGIIESMSIDPKTALRRHPLTLQPVNSGVDADTALIANALFERVVEPRLVQPTFVLDWPVALCPLTRRHPTDPKFALRFELFINGMEIGNAYSELNDPEIQRENLVTQVQGEGDETMRVMDEDFVEALEYAMPPAGGLGLGIDRIVMLLTSSTSIRDVLLFPLQKPQQQRTSGQQTTSEGEQL